ncbi:hypothetical protein Cgig2_007467 [Carnegiea gigantea]|uniref:RNase H type-1 domain-containing protein n=1 Tax=Carnegiea gigantea TaxID=171969 RepID=A0A9Q1QEA3_9CARY|nr:hypothetical protein Cgig2_007467 [Carnegiea gigantea]
MRDVILQGSRWLAGDGRSIEAWNSRWLLRPTTFMVITPKPSHLSSVRVCDLIDHDNAHWRENLVREYFLPVDAEVILTVPLCASWPHDKLIWHDSPDGAFSESDTHALLECQLALQIWEGSPVNSGIWDAKYRSMEDCIVRAAKQSMYKLNFDGRKVGVSGWGWGFVIRNSLGDVMMAGTEEGQEFTEPLVEEALACLLGMRCAMGAGFDNIIVEGDCQSLIQSLGRKRVEDTFAGFIVKDILSLASCFGFRSWSFVKRGGNRVAYELAHLHRFVFVLELEKWISLTA